MYKISFCLLFSLTLLSCSFTDPQNYFTLKRAKGFPQWLYGTDQTSGITFIGLDKSGNKNFLLADDIGKLHRMVISEDTIISVKDIVLSPAVEEYLSPFPKRDFEEIVYDKYTGKVYLSIEGNGKLFIDFVGIYQVAFAGNDIYSDTVTEIKRLDITPSEKYLNHSAPNIGFEGLAADENYLYLGLEGFQTGALFADSTFIYIAEKHSLKIVDSINTKQYGIATVCGLFSDSNNSIFGIDRNNRKVFHMIIGSDHKVLSCSVQDISSDMPVYHYEYVAALESITIDNENNLYLVDDPWKSFYMPSEEVRNKLDQKTIDNYKKAIPIIYKFNINF